MTALEEYRACMERLQRVREALAALLDKPRQIDRLDDEAMATLTMPANGWKSHLNISKGRHNIFPPREIVERLRLQYPAGCRVELVSMDDPYARLKPGDQGTVIAVDDIGTVHIDWDNGSGLGAAYGADVIRRI